MDEASEADQAVLNERVESNWVAFAAVAFNAHHVYGRGIIQLSASGEIERYVTEDQIEDVNLKRELATYDPRTSLLVFCPMSHHKVIMGKFMGNQPFDEAAVIYQQHRHDKNSPYRDANATRLIRMTEIKEYEPVVQLAWTVIEKLHSTLTTPYRQDVLQLATRLIGQSQTVFSLSQHTALFVPTLGKRNPIVDVSSIAGIFRMIVETYLTMHEVFFAPDSDNDFDFFHARWMLIGLHNIRAHTPDDVYQAHAPEMVEPMRIDATQRMEQTRQYQAMLRQKKKHKQAMKALIQRNRDAKEWERLAQSANIASADYQKIYTAFSGYIHADGYTSFKLNSSDETDFDAVADILPYLVTGLVAKMVCDFAKRYEEAAAIAKASTPVYERIKEFERSLSAKPVTESRSTN